MTLRSKTTIWIAGVEAAFLLILLWQALDYLHRSESDALVQRAQQSGHLLTLLTANAVITRDLATLNELASQVSQDPHVRYVRFLDDQGVLAQSGPDNALARPFTADQRLRDVDDGTYDVRLPIEEGGQVFAQVELGFETKHLQALLDDATLTLGGIALAELLLVALVSLWVGSYLTRGLKSLRTSIQQIESGDWSPVCLKGADELTTTAEAFNTMANQLQQKQAQTEAATQALAGLNEQLAERESHLSAVLDSVVDGIITIDGRGVIDRVNPAAEQIFGYPEGALVGQNVSCLMPAPHRAQHDGYLHRYLMEGGPRIIGVGREVEGVRQDGSRVLLDLSVSEIKLGGERYFVGLLRDKSELVRLEAEARRSDKIKAMITDASLDAMVTVDMEGLVQEYNVAAERILGWSRQEVMGQLMESFFIPEEMRAAHRHGMARFKQNGSGPLIGGRVEVEAVRKDGCRVPVELSLVAAEIDGERLATAFLRDISERKQAEQALIAARDAAEEASLAKSRFLSHMSHEIRSPLNAVLGAVNLIAERITEPEHRRLLRTATSSGQALLAVINEVLDFSKIEAGQLSICSDNIDLNSLVEEVLCSAQARLEKPQVDLLCNVAPGLGHIVSDPIRLRQVINILVDNAVKFTDQGLVSVDIEPSRLNDQDAIKVMVCDTGIGIPAEHLANVFNEFEQVDATRDSRYGGTGLGLTIARRLVELLGGEIQVESQPHNGSCFHFTIPVQLGEAPEPAQPNLTSLWVFSPNTRLCEAFAHKAEQMKVSFGHAKSLADLQHAPRCASGVILVDERCFPEPEQTALWATLEGHPARVVCLCNEGTQVPESSASLLRIAKPLACYRLCEQLHGRQPESTTPDLDPAISLSGRVLLVEDVAANRMVAGEMLRSRGFEVITANDGQEALEAAEVESFDVILMDIRMPRMNGYDAVMALRRGHSINRNTPVIALTANAEKSEIARCQAAGMNEFVSKPFDTENLLEAVNRCLADTAAAEVVPMTEKPTNAPAQPQTLLDQATLDQLANDTSPEVMVPMLEMFIEELDSRVAAISAAESDMVQLREQAHALKSCSATFGALPLHHLAKLLEDAARDLQPDHAISLRSKLLSTAALTRSRYIDYLTGMRK